MSKDERPFASDIENVLIACEFSGTVRDAFRNEGFDAVSCDIRETEQSPEHHIKGDVMKLLEERGEEFDLMIAHPPCTYLSNSGVRWLYEKEERWQDMIEGGVFFRNLLRKYPILQWRILLCTSGERKWQGLNTTQRNTDKQFNRGSLGNQRKNGYVCG